MTYKPDLRYGPFDPKTERLRDRQAQDEIRDRANYSLAILGMGAVTRGGGRFLNIRVDPPKPIPKFISDRV